MKKDAPLVSAIYTGTIAHTRLVPVAHSFRYPIFMMFLDLDELPGLLKTSRWLRNGGWAPAVFRREDYYGPADRPLKDCIRELVQDSLARPVEGPIRMLTHLRYFGHCFNPVTFYYAHDLDGSLAAIIAEINNTPWNERHQYVLSTADAAGNGNCLAFAMNKDFHVSPFIPMDQQYHWRFSPAGEERLRIHMQNFDSEGQFFFAHLALKRQPLSIPNLRSTLLLYPFMTLRVVAGIYWQAALLKLKGCRFYTHSSPGPTRPTVVIPSST